MSINKEMKQIIEKLKNGEHTFYKISFVETSEIDFILYKEYYNEDKTKKIKISHKYCPELYMSEYKMTYFNAKGVMFYQGSTILVDDQYEYAHINERFEYFEEEIDAINDFYKQNENYIILKNGNEYYTISQFFDMNTKEKVMIFIEKMNSNGNEFKIVRGTFKEDKVVEDE